MTAFVLNPRLVTATLPVGDLPLCRALVMDDQRYPWLLMVPRRKAVEEMWDLDPEDRARLIEEVTLAGEIIRDHFQASRMNIADIGNKAPQMHIHVVGRTTDDPAWPKVVWSRPYEPWSDRGAFRSRQQLFQQAFAERTAFQTVDAHVDPGVEQL